MYRNAFWRRSIPSIQYRQETILRLLVLEHYIFSSPDKKQSLDILIQWDKTTWTRLWGAQLGKVVSVIRDRHILNQGAWYLSNRRLTMLCAPVLAHFPHVATKSEKAYCGSSNTYGQFPFWCYRYCSCGNIRSPWWLIQHVPISRILFYNQITHPTEESVALCRDKIISKSYSSYVYNKNSR